MTAPRVATEYTAYGKVQALDGAVLAECLKGILRACWSETARRTAFQRRYADLIESDQKHERGYRHLLQSCQYFSGFHD